jgi:hypothetical protein
VTDEGPGWPRLWFWLALVVLVGILIFSHGCHSGDHDDELSVTVPKAVQKDGGQ